MTSAICSPAADVTFAPTMFGADTSSVIIMANRTDNSSEMQRKKSRPLSIIAEHLDEDSGYSEMTIHGTLVRLPGGEMTVTPGDDAERAHVTPISSKLTAAVERCGAPSLETRTCGVIFDNFDEKGLSGSNDDVSSLRGSAGNSCADSERCDRRNSGTSRADSSQSVQCQSFDVSAGASRKVSASGACESESRSVPALNSPSTVRQTRESRSVPPLNSPSTVRKTRKKAITHNPYFNFTSEPHLGPADSQTTDSANQASDYPHISCFLGGVSDYPHNSSFLGGVSDYPHNSSFLGGVSDYPHNSSFLGGVSDYPHISSFLSGVSAVTRHSVNGVFLPEGHVSQGNASPWRDFSSGKSGSCVSAVGINSNCPVGSVSSVCTFSSQEAVDPVNLKTETIHAAVPGSANNQLESSGSEGDLTLLKDTATKLKLKTRRQSYLTWRAKYLDSKPVDFQPEVKAVREGDGKLTKERKERMDSALEWIKKQLVDLRRQDQSLARQLLAIRHELSNMKLAASCEEHQDLLEEAQDQIEELRELSRFADVPPEMMGGSSSLKHIGVTKMNLSSRRFSTC